MTERKLTTEGPLPEPTPGQPSSADLPSATTHSPSPAPTVPAANDQSQPEPDVGQPTPDSGPQSDPFEAWGTGERKKIAPVLWSMVEALLKKHPVTADYCLVTIFDPHTSIGTYELDRIYDALKRRNGHKEKNVLLMLMSGGGKIEPAYQISKLCKSFAREKFVVCVPRLAKSAATLIALGADEIHLGTLGQLGPIDPQVEGLPALAVARALDRLAELVERHPRSAEMLASYLKDKLAVQQIGYYERVAESAVQYAQRLLSNKPASVLARDPQAIATTLVHEYKDHGFVIDIDEAQAHLGAEWVRSETAETKFAEDFYMMFDFAEYLALDGKKRIALIGALTSEDMPRTIFLLDRRD